MRKQSLLLLLIIFFLSPIALASQEYGRLKVFSKTGRHQVYINNKHVGPTPLSVKLTSGPHLLKVVDEKYFQSIMEITRIRKKITIIPWKTKIIIVEKEMKNNPIEAIEKKTDEEIFELPEKRSKSAIEIETSTYMYREPGLMQLSGITYGILYSNVTHFDQIMSKYEGRIFLGTVNYDGATQAGVPLTFDGIPDLGYEFRGLWGRDNPLSDDFFLTPYIGVGYRYLNDNMQLKSAAGYQRESNYYYVPLGLEVTRHDDSGGFFEAMIEYDYLLFGKQVSHLSDFASEWNDPINWQHSGYGLKALISFLIESANFSYQAKLYMRLWDIADSDTANLEFSGVPVGTAIEPKNNTSEVGISLGVRF